MRCCCNELSPSEQLDKHNSECAVRILTLFIKNKIRLGSDDLSYEMLAWYCHDRKLALRNTYESNAKKLIQEEIINIESLIKRKWDAEFLAAQKLIAGN